MSKTTDTDAPVLTTCRMPRDELDRLRAVATITGQSQTEIIRSAVRDHLDQEIRRRRIGKLVDQLIEQRRKAK